MYNITYVVDMRWISQYKIASIMIIEVESTPMVTVI